MTSQLGYILTERMGQADSAYQSAASTVEGLRKLRTLPGTAPSIVTVVNDLGNIFHLDVNANRNGFGAISGQGIPNPDALCPTAFITSVGNLAAATEAIRLHRDFELDYEKRDFSHNAIVHRDHEQRFQEVARALGLEPVKISEELF